MHPASVSKTGTFVYPPPHHQCESSFGVKNSAHFAQGRGPIGKELQAQLAIHNGGRAQACRDFVTSPEIKSYAL